MAIAFPGPAPPGGSTAVRRSRPVLAAPRGPLPRNFVDVVHIPARRGGPPNIWTVTDQNAGVNLIDPLQNAGPRFGRPATRELNDDGGHFGRGFLLGGMFSGHMVGNFGGLTGAGSPGARKGRPFMPVPGRVSAPAPQTAHSGAPAVSAGRPLPDRPNRSGCAAATIRHRPEPAWCDKPRINGCAGFRSTDAGALAFLPRRPEALAKARTSQQVSSERAGEMGRAGP